MTAGIEPVSQRPGGSGRIEVEDLRDEFGDDWDIRGQDGRLVAEHRHEPFDARRERWVIRTTVEAGSPELLHVRLTIQQAVRGAEAR